MSDVHAGEPVHPLHRLATFPARPFPFAALNVAALTVIQGGGIWVGCAVEETTNAARARLNIGDGTGNAIATQIAPYTLSAGESRSDFWPGHGVMFTSGLTVQTTLGSVAGVLWAVLLTREELALISSHRQGFPTSRRGGL